MKPNVIDEPSYRSLRHLFRDRVHAAELLAKKLDKYKGRGTIVLAIPSGGVPVGYVVAERIGATLDLALVRKIQLPWNPEAGFGAVTWDGIVIFNEPMLRALNLSDEKIDECVLKTKKTIQERLEKFRGGKPFPNLSDKTVLLVDDGLASGFTMLAAVRSVKKRAPKRIVVATPTASAGAIELVSPHVDELICLNIRDDFIFAVADAYQKWYDLSDEEVLNYLKKG